MAAKPPFVLHQPQHQQPEASSSHPHQARLPVIPDLRFEHSYLRSIRPYVEIRSSELDRTRRDGDAADQGTRGEQHESVTTSESDLQPLTLADISSEVVHIQWGRVGWITVRDQIISPFLQGALWALASYFLTPLSAQVGTRMGSYAKSHISSSKEGTGVGWLRSWVSGLGFGASNIDIGNTRDL